MTDVASPLLFLYEIMYKKNEKGSKCKGEICMKFRLHRYLLIIIIVFVLGNTLITGLSFEKSLNQLSHQIYESFDTLATIQGDSFYETHQSAETYYRDYNEYKELLEKISEEKEVEFSSIGYLLEHIHLTNAVGRSTGIYNDVTQYDSDLGYFPFTSGDNLGADLIGTNTAELIDELTDHILLTDGRHFNSEEIDHDLVAIIPNNLVNESGNPIKTGDTISIQGDLSGPNYIRDDLYGQGYSVPALDLLVVGMYRVINIEEDVPPFKYSNRIYVPNKVLEDYSNMVIKSIEDFMGVDDIMKLESEEYFPYFLPNAIMPPYFKLKSYEDAVIFQEKCEQLLNNTTYIKENYKIVTTNDSITRIIEPVSSIEKIAGIIKNSSFIALGLILFIIMGFFIRNSTYEIAIYRALGQKKSKIIIKFCGEIIISILIAFLSIRLTAPKVTAFISHTIMESVEIEENMVNEQYWMESNQIENKELFKDFNIEPDNQEYLFCGIYLLIVSLSGCIFMILKIIKTNVKDILLQQ